MTKVLIIGAGIGQIYLVQTAKKMGLYVIVVSPKGYPAIDYADELFECDIYDYDRIVEFAKNAHISAVFSDQNDLMMPTVAYVSEKLKLPGNSLEMVLSYCNKEKFRLICDEIGNPSPKHISVRNLSFPENFNVPFPWIVKPTDSQSSMGISVVNDKKEYANAVSNALSMSKHKQVIVEQFFKGKEFVCEGFVYDGRYYNLSFGDRVYFKGIEHPIPCQTIFPSSLDSCIQQKIIECEEKFTRKVHPRFGIIHSEYLVDTEGNICVVESAIRGGGVYISSHLIPLSTGLDINSMLIDCALGKKVDMENWIKCKHRKISAYLCFTLPTGIIDDIKGIDELQLIDGVKLVDIRNLCVGDLCEPMTAKGMRKGPIIVSAHNRTELSNAICKIHETLKIRVKTSNGLKGIIWE